MAYREPKETGWLCVMCRQEKEQMLELPPLMTNKQIHTHIKRKAPKPATFPASFPRGWPEGKGYSLAVDDGTLMEWKERSSTSRCLFVSSLAELFVWGTLSYCLSFWRVSCFPSPVSQNTEQPLTRWGLGHGWQNTVWFICCVRWTGKHKEQFWFR